MVLSLGTGGRLEAGYLLHEEWREQIPRVLKALRPIRDEEYKGKEEQKKGGQLKLEEEKKGDLIPK